MRVLAVFLLAIDPAAAFCPVSNYAVSGIRPVFNARTGVGRHMPARNGIVEDEEVSSFEDSFGVNMTVPDTVPPEHHLKPPAQDVIVVDTESGDQKAKHGHQDTPFTHSALAGGTASCIASIVFHPLDTVKTVLQSGAGNAGVQALGVEGLYRGVVPAALSSMPGCAARMGSYELIKRFLLRARLLRRVPRDTLIFLAAACSVIPMSVVRAPLEMIKTCMQADGSSSMFGAIRAAWGVGGLAGLAGMYNGVGLQLLRDVPFFGFNLLFYENLKAKATARKAKATGVANPELSPLELLFIGFTAQGIAGLLTNPTDVLKTHVQIGASANMGAALASVLEQGGPMALMAGAAVRVAWIAPQGMIYYPVYESVLRFLSRRRKRRRESLANKSHT